VCVRVLQAGRPRRRGQPDRRGHRRKDRRSSERTGRPQMSVGGGASQVNQWRMCGGPRETRRERQMERGPQGWGEEGGGSLQESADSAPWTG